MPYATDALAGQKVLVLEDEYLLADYITSVVESVGATPQGPFASGEDALISLASGDGLPTIATLDVNLLDGPSFKVADELDQLGIPFVFITAYGATSLPNRFAARPVLTKPFAPFQVVQELLALLERHAGHS
ncbi:response regulator [Sphingomonas sp. NBWT7]|uniref:response regulator n=1 Tax=Sphingomonas sp. NBWT7 TaxID=2596913 RepID=UPI0016259C31|nr:response regulator [Sphingomonas sp. NBWT7]QNE32983.1 response regulator [Sphingomonas sp. NBWT7]